MPPFSLIQLGACLEARCSAQAWASAEAAVRGDGCLPCEAENTFLPGKTVLKLNLSSETWVCRVALHKAKGSSVKGDSLCSLPPEPPLTDRPALQRGPQHHRRLRLSMRAEAYVASCPDVTAQAHTSHRPQDWPQPPASCRALIWWTHLESPG